MGCLQSIITKMQRHDRCLSNLLSDIFQFLIQVKQDSSRCSQAPAAPAQCRLLALTGVAAKPHADVLLYF